MNLNSHLKRLLIKAGLNESEASLYLFVLENKGCSISDIYKKSDLSKSSAYRAFEALKNLELLRSDKSSWKTNLTPLPLSSLIKNLENKTRTQKRVITELKLLNTAKTLTTGSNLPSIETFKGEKIFEKYIELSETPFHTNLSFGSFEDFSSSTKDLVKTEKTYIKNRMKKGANALACVTKTGPATHEIIDCDKDENRLTKILKEQYAKPIWITAYEGNNFVYIWNLDERGQTFATLIDSRQVADFYKNFIYSQ